MLRLCMRALPHGPPVGLISPLEATSGYAGRGLVQPYLAIPYSSETIEPS